MQSSPPHSAERALGLSVTHSLVPFRLLKKSVIMWNVTVLVKYLFLS